MRLFRRAIDMLGFGPGKRTIVDDAIDRSRAVGAKADDINESLSVYLTRPDPFKAFAVDVFERDQESRIHRGTRT